MARTDAYATAQQYRDARNKPSSVNDATLDRALRAVSRYIDQRLGYSAGFGKDDEATARLYVPPAVSTVLDVDPIASSAGVIVKIDENGDGSFSETAVPSSSYRLLPLNAALDGWPFRQIETTSWGTLSGWPWRGLVQVTAIYGWPAVPDAIVEATIALTDLLRMDGPRATRVINELNQVLGVSTAARDIVSQLMSVYGRAVVA